MPYISSAGDAIDPAGEDFSLVQIIDIEEKVDKNDKPYILFVYKPVSKLDDEKEKPRKLIMFERLLGTRQSVYDAVLKAVGIDRASDWKKEEVIGKQLRIEKQIDPEFPTSNNYDNWVSWDIYPADGEPNRSNSEYETLCEKFNFVPKGKGDDSRPGFSKEGVTGSPAKQKASAEDLEDLPF